MALRSAPQLRIVGRARRLRLRTLGDWESRPLDALHECCGAAMALEKAMRETVESARAAGHSWEEIGKALGITKQAAWERFSRGLRHPITGDEIDRENRGDA